MHGLLRSARGPQGGEDSSMVLTLGLFLITVHVLVLDVCLLTVASSFGLLSITMALKLEGLPPPILSKLPVKIFLTWLLSVLSTFRGDTSAGQRQGFCLVLAALL